MKNFIPVFSTCCLLLVYNLAAAQTDLQNTGILYVSGATDVLYINGSFTNAAGAALTNNGSLHVKQQLTNGQSAMAVGAGTLYLNGSAAQTLSGTQPFRTFNLVTDNGAGFTLNNDLSVSGVHTFTAGVIVTSATPNYLMYEAGASYTGDADGRHVNGWVRKTGTTAFSFPVGNGTVERQIGISALSGSSVFNARYAGATPNTGNVVAPLVTVDQYENWRLDKISGGTAVANMNWDNSKITMPPYALADIRTASYITGNWTQTGGSATGNVATTGTIASNALSSFGQMVLGSISLALPVTLLQFTAVKSNGLGLVSWTTTDEVNVSHFEIQRSDDGLQFYTIGNTAATNQAAMQQYSYTDSKALNEITYYRLRSVDMDGKVKLSNVAVVNNNDGGSRYLAIANPAHGSIRVRATSMTGVFQYRLNTLAGQTIQHGPLKIAATMADIPLAASIKPGVYILQIQKTGFSFTQKVLVQ